MKTRVRGFLITLVSIASIALWFSGCASYRAEKRFERAYADLAEVENRRVFPVYGIPESGPAHGMWNIKWTQASLKVRGAWKVLEAEVPAERLRGMLIDLMKRYGVIMDLLPDPGLPVGLMEEVITREEVLNLVERQGFELTTQGG